MADANTPSSKSTLVAKNGTVLADDKSIDIITLTLKADDGNVITTDLSSKLHLVDGSAKFAFKAADLAHGTYTAEFKTATAGKHILFVEYDGTNLADVKAEITATDASSAIDAKKSTITTDAELLTNSANKAIITINLKNSAGNAISGKAISLLVDGKPPVNDHYTLSQATAGATAGEYKASFSAKEKAPPKSYTINAKIDEVTLDKATSIQIALAPQKPLLSKGIALTGRSTPLQIKYYLSTSIDDSVGNVGTLPEGAIILEAFVYCTEAFTNELTIEFGDNYKAKLSPEIGLNPVTLPSMPSVADFNNAQVNYSFSAQNTKGKGRIIVIYVSNR